MDKKQRDILAKRFILEGNIGDRIFKLRKSKELTQRELANSLRVSHVTISQWENGESEPKGSNLISLSFALDCSPTHLMYGIDFDKTESDIQPNTLCIRYPVLTHVQAANLGIPLDVNSLKNINLWFESDAPLMGDGFWTQVNNDSMTAPLGISIPEGTYTLFDTSRDAVSGDLVMAKFQDSTEATFKKYVIDAGQKYLKGLNPTWPMALIKDDCEIIGVAVETKLRLI
ncbi:hypothetical protein BS639_14920 [Rouxiella silvae]|uniref:Helix-turn-helix domain-containing protein n=1 Tax=Rouxiella silvae TaxID=1646373 RepID=A0AA40X1S1_9GAMM|nr:S24 family peptidase [Rouxiella silvae]KQN46950.1 hypothetical protein ASE93_12640 [Serratia sp. Leaf50]MBF6636557.1 helix-turn-helix domain-containing protein [Rouxiella silvae]ORJ20487.1 hypothetical protein BS639_14920 [Rouxiella silvae]